jgi:hypothetical protein
MANSKTTMRIILTIFVLYNSAILVYSQEEKEIYYKILTEYVYKLKPLNIDYSSGMTLIIRDHPKYMRSLDNNDFERFKDTYKNLGSETFKALVKKNLMAPEFIDPKFDGIKVVILKEDSIPGRNMLSTKYPDWILSILEFSRVGFNESKDQAIVYYGFDSGPGVGGGCYLVFEKKRNKWKQKGFIPAWAA